MTRVSAGEWPWAWAWPGYLWGEVSTLPPDKSRFGVCSMLLFHGRSLLKFMAAINNVSFCALPGLFVPL